MLKKLQISYEVFEEENITVLSVIDPEKDEVLNMFYDEEADEMFHKLTEVEDDDREWNNWKFNVLFPK